MERNEQSNPVLITYTQEKDGDEGQISSPSVAVNNPTSPSSKKMLSPSTNLKKTSPFRATRMWNQLVQAFSNTIVLKRKRWKMRMYHDCFTGSEAVNTILLYLKSKVSATTSRAQAIQLLQKFLQCHILEDVCRKNSRMFHDNNYLYRMSKENNPSLDTRLSRSPKTIVPSHKSLSKILGTPSSSKRLSITLTKSAGSQLESPCSPSVKVDGNGMHSEKEPVKITPLATGLGTVSLMSNSPKKLDATSPSSLTSSVKSKEEWSKGVVELGQISLSPPFGLINECYDSPYSPFSPGICLAGRGSFQVGRSLFFANSAELKNFRRKRSSSLLQEKESQPKNTFTDEGYVVFTRKSKSFRDRLRSRAVSLCSPSKKTKVELVTEMPRPNTPFSDRKTNGGIDNFASDYIPKRSSISKTEPPAKESEELEYIWKTAALSSLKILLSIDSLDNLLNFSVISGHDILSNYGSQKDDALKEVPGWVISAMKCLVNWPPGSNENDICDLPSYEGFEQDIFLAIKDYYEKAVEEPLLTYNFFKVLQKAADLIPLGKQDCIKALQLCCLMVPTWNRNHLQVLLRFMARVSKNEELKLSEDVPNEELTVHNFQPMIISNKNASMADDLTGIRLVLFLVENHEEVFQLPSNIQAQVDYQLAMALGSQECPVLPEISEGDERVPEVKRLSGPTTFCKRVSMEEYERQTVQNTRVAITSLLHSIINDDVMSEKERKKKLKLFKKAYPDIYNAKFPGDNLSTCSTSNHRTMRIKKVVRPFFFRHASTSYQDDGR